MDPFVEFCVVFSVSLVILGKITSEVIPPGTMPLDLLKCFPLFS